MKKTVKALITATAVAAVVGVGAVSFAAWSGGESANVTVSGSTGAINTVGSIVVKAAKDTGTYATDTKTNTMKTLYPVDQTSIGETDITYWAFDVEVTGEGNQAATIQGTIIGGTGTSSNAVLRFTQQTEAPSAASDSDANIKDAQSITLTDKKATVYVYMVASNTDAMNATITLTFTATATN